jgi:hypothetical protein
VLYRLRGNANLKCGESIAMCDEEESGMLPCVWMGYAAGGMKPVCGYVAWDCRSRVAERRSVGWGGACWAGWCRLCGSGAASGMRANLRGERWLSRTIVTDGDQDG